MLQVAEMQERFESQAYMASVLQSFTHSRLAEILVKDPKMHDFAGVPQLVQAGLAELAASHLHSRLQVCALE